MPLNCAALRVTVQKLKFKKLNKSFCNTLSKVVLSFFSRERILLTDRKTGGIAINCYLVKKTSLQKQQLFFYEKTDPM